ncbi:MAG TPA: peptidylprolyl isomerase [Candidatus Eisenbacteria bacterium]|jgi:hypothetical protein
MRLAPLVLTSVLLLLPAIAVAEAAPVRTGSGGGGAGGSPAISPTRPPVSPRSVLAPRDYLAKRALPDSVLLRINGREDVTRRRFVRAVRLLGGDPDSLTPASRDRFLELVIEQRLLAARAVREPRPWDRSDSVEFLSERDNVLVRAALADQFTRIEARRRALGQPDLDEQAMGVAARESLMLELKPVYDEELLKLVGSYFAELPEATPNMSPQQQIELTQRLPAVPAADTLKVLARSRLGAFTVAELFSDWRRLASIYRPRVLDNEGVRALVQNSLFERLIRQAADDPALAKRADVAAVIADRVEYHAVSQYLRHGVVADIPTDSLALLAYYGSHRSDFDRPPRAVLVVLTLDGPRAADSLARRFRIPGEAESLAVRAQRAGVTYTHVATAAADSALYAQALRTGAGGVAGPDHVEGGWRVYKVLSLDPRTTQPFADVRPLVERAWVEFESERRIRALLDGLKREARLERNERALRTIVLPASGGRP